MISLFGVPGLHQCRGIRHNGDLAEDVHHADVARLEQLLLVRQVLPDQLVVAGALHHLGDQVLARIAELRVSVVQAGVGDASGSRHIVDRDGLGGNCGNQGGDRSVQLVLQQDFSERAAGNFDALCGWALQPGHLRRLVADRTEAPGYLHRSVLQLGKIGCSDSSVRTVAVHTALGSGQGLEERLLEEVTGEAVRRQHDCATACGVESSEILIQRLESRRHDVFVENLHLRQGHELFPYDCGRSGNRLAIAAVRSSLVPPIFPFAAPPPPPAPAAPPPDALLPAINGAKAVSFANSAFSSSSVAAESLPC